MCGWRGSKKSVMRLPLSIPAWRTEHVLLIVTGEYKAIGQGPYFRMLAVFIMNIVYQMIFTSLFGELRAITAHGETLHRRALWIAFSKAHQSTLLDGCPVNCCRQGCVSWWMAGGRTSGCYPV